MRKYQTNQLSTKLNVLIRPCAPFAFFYHHGFYMLNLFLFYWCYNGCCCCLIFLIIHIYVYKTTLSVFILQKSSQSRFCFLQLFIFSHIWGVRNFFTQPKCEDSLDYSEQESHVSFCKIFNNY